MASPPTPPVNRTSFNRPPPKVTETMVQKDQKKQVSNMAKLSPQDNLAKLAGATQRNQQPR